MACRWRFGPHTLRLHRFIRRKVIRSCCTDNSKTPEETEVANRAANSSEKKNSGLNRILQRRIKNELSYALPTVPLPPKLTEAVNEVLKYHPKKEVITAGNSLIDHLSARKKMTTITEWSKSLLKYNQREALATMVSRLNGTYSTTLRVLNEIRRRRPEFQPETVLDFGSGLGTAVWATNEIWNKSVYEYLCVDTSEEMENLAKILRKGGTKSGKDLIENVYHKQYLPVSGKQQYDLVIAAYSLGEMSPKLLRTTLETLWRNTLKYLVLIEMGDKVGFHCISEARTHLIKIMREQVENEGVKTDGDDEPQSSGYIFAPCTHELTCPYVRKGKSYCRFGQRSHLSICQERDPWLKRAGFVTENYSYLVLSRGNRPADDNGYARLLKERKQARRMVICNICPPNGYSEQRIYTKIRSGKEVYRMVRHHTQWGDLVPLVEKPAEKTEPTTDDKDELNNVDKLSEDDTMK
ncbi:ribosome assembly protein METTL17, mitochondrial-like isoform X2 [Dysidea avara]|uniref:ribosome assembly protein METTL17, mitochondrial-like isoform X2 n=1 Tax=Dysidea avara TaxID=196820 RepID=UPI0033250F94